MWSNFRKSEYLKMGILENPDFCIHTKYKHKLIKELQYRT